MSMILAVDCCLKLTGAALMSDGKILGSGRKQTAELPLMVGSMLQRNRVSFDALDYVALTNGPGYFTGIRVGAAYASGLAYASGAKVIPVSSLEMLAESSGLSGKILAVVYAGHGYVYAECNGFLEAGEYTLDEVREWLAKNPDAIAISDDPERSGLTEAVRVRPSVTALCELAQERLESERLDDAISPLELKISYYRAPQGVK
ncbi:MAG: tRNA (adenosine(37)-N6)-threonylcarbamoyltransferase complex dimerization subunit type 1 TsaB [Synergistaceae bacterium]|nr:tRNA (adenosine(37)-N6)-threonylcarbamoyltransferase complex dimerization subunit type 1 TsaB [Synergistaceae bacterium]